MAVNWNILAQPQPEPVQFNPLAAIQAHRQGVADFRSDRKDNALLAAGRSMAAGDSKGAQAALYGAGEFDAGFKIQEHQFKQAQHELEVLTRAGRAADLADTPEKWAQVHRTLGLPQQYADFRTGRETARMLAYDKAALLQQELQRSQMSLNRSHASLFDAQAAAAGVKENPYQVEALKERAKADEKRRADQLSGAESADTFARMAGDWQKLASQSPEGTFGPAAASPLNRGLITATGGTIGLGSLEAEQTRMMLESRLNEMDLAMAQAYMKGQGAVTDAERAMISRIRGTLQQDPKGALALMKDLEARFRQRAEDSRKEVQTGPYGQPPTVAPSRFVQQPAPAAQQPAPAAQPPKSVPGVMTGPMPPVTSAPQVKAAPPAQITPQPKSKAEYDALPPGSHYIDADGNVRKKK